MQCKEEKERNSGISTTRIRIYSFQVLNGGKNGFVSFLTTRPFTKIKDAFKRIVITGDMISPHYDEDGILLVNIYDFLLNPKVLEE